MLSWLSQVHTRRPCRCALLSYQSVEEEGKVRDAKDDFRGMEWSQMHRKHQANVLSGASSFLWQGQGHREKEYHTVGTKKREESEDDQSAPRKGQLQETPKTTESFRLTV